MSENILIYDESLDQKGTNLNQQSGPGNRKLNQVAPDVKPMNLRREMKLLKNKFFANT